MRKDELAIVLKSKLDQLDQVPLKAYQQLTDLMEIQYFEKDEIIRGAGTKEDYSYYLLSGVLAFEREGKLIRLFFEDQVVFDRQAYQTGIRSPYELKAIQEGYMTKLSRDNEALILKTISEFEKLSAALQQKAQDADDLWIQISQKHYRDAYALLNRYFKGFFNVLNTDQLAQLFQIDKRTISRHNKYLYQIKNSPVAKVKMGEILTYNFYSSQHSEAEIITNKVIKWLKNQYLLTDPRHIRKFREHKMTYLAIRLYPEAPLNKSIWIGKLYAWLFLVDDYTDALAGTAKLDFWSKIEESVNNIMDPFYGADLVDPNPFELAFHDLWNGFEQLRAEWYRPMLIEELQQYFRNNFWEAKNRAFSEIPKLEDYLSKRPYFSGGRLALELIPLCLQAEPEQITSAWNQIAALRKQAAELIFISNDILSFQKESKIKDFHNWIVLLMHHDDLSKEEAMMLLLKRHDQILKSFETKTGLYTKQYSPENTLMLSMIKQLKFQISGAVTWSVEDTKRYLPTPLEEVNKHLNGGVENRSVNIAKKSKAMNHQN